MWWKEEDMAFMKPMFWLEDDKDLFNLYYLLHCWNEETIQYYESIAVKNWYTYEDVNRAYNYLIKMYDWTKKEREDLILKTFFPYKMDYLLNFSFLQFVGEPKSVEIYENLKKTATKNWVDDIHVNLSFVYLKKLFQSTEVTDKMKEDFIERVFAPSKIGHIMSDLGSAMVQYEPELEEIEESYIEDWRKNWYSENTINMALFYLEDLIGIGQWNYA